MSGQCCNCTGNSEICKGTKHYEFECRGIITNPPFLFVIEPFLVDKSAINMCNVNLCDKLTNKNSEIQMRKFPICNIIMIEDLMHLMHDIDVVMTNCPVEFPTMEFSIALMMMKG